MNYSSGLPCLKWVKTSNLGNLADFNFKVADATIFSGRHNSGKTIRSELAASMICGTGLESINSASDAMRATENDIATVCAGIYTTPSGRNIDVFAVYRRTERSVSDTWHWNPVRYSYSCDEGSVEAIAPSGQQDDYQIKISQHGEESFAKKKNRKSGRAAFIYSRNFWAAANDIAENFDVPDFFAEVTAELNPLASANINTAGEIEINAASVCNFPDTGISTGGYSASGYLMNLFRSNMEEYTSAMKILNFWLDKTDIIARLRIKKTEHENLGFQFRVREPSGRLSDWIPGESMSSSARMCAALFCRVLNFRDDSTSLRLDHIDRCLDGTALDVLYRCAAERCAETKTPLLVETCNENPAGLVAAAEAAGLSVSINFGAYPVTGHTAR